MTSWCPVCDHVVYRHVDDPSAPFPSVFSSPVHATTRCPACRKRRKRGWPSRMCQLTRQQVWQLTSMERMIESLYDPCPGCERPTAPWWLDEVDGQPVCRFCGSAVG